MNDHVLIKSDDGQVLRRKIAKQNGFFGVFYMKNSKKDPTLFLRQADSVIYGFYEVMTYVSSVGDLKICETLVEEFYPESMLEELRTFMAEKKNGILRK